MSELSSKGQGDGSSQWVGPGASTACHGHPEKRGHGGGDEPRGPEAWVSAQFPARGTPARCGPAGKFAALCGSGTYHFPGIFAVLKRMIKERPHFPS